MQKKLRGEKGTKVTVGVMRPGISKPIDITITRDKIPLYSVTASFMLEDGVGYRITSYNVCYTKLLRSFCPFIKSKAVRVLITTPMAATIIT